MAIIPRVPAGQTRPLVVILCGGRGTRLQGDAPETPKPLVEIGGMPIVWHVIRIYAAQGFTRFILATGFRALDVEFFVARVGTWPAGIQVRCVDTGIDTPTGGRLRALRHELAGETFCVTYADGLADIDLTAELELHRSRRATGTVAVVRPELVFGVAEVSGEDRITGFREKPRSEHWVNGGFFVFEPELLEHLKPDSVLEREPLETLAAGGRLHAFRHEGFWRCMDTLKDAAQLEDLWAGDPPWKIWT